MPTIIGRTPAILLTLTARGIDGTGRLPEFAFRWLFHAPSSSIRGSPGLFVVFSILGDFVEYTVQVFFSVYFLYLYEGISPRHSPSHSRDIGVLQLLSLWVIWRLLSVIDPLVFWRPDPSVLSFWVHIRLIVVVHRLCLLLCHAFLLVALAVTRSLFISFWVLG